jgi:hypothetical protein
LRAIIMAKPPMTAKLARTIRTKDHAHALRGVVKCDSYADGGW